MRLWLARATRWRWEAGGRGLTSGAMDDVVARLRAVERMGWLGSPRLNHSGDRIARA
jgi:hypothetical protein